MLSLILKPFSTVRFVTVALLLSLNDLTQSNEIIALILFCVESVLPVADCCSPSPSTENEVVAVLSALIVLILLVLTILPPLHFL